MSHHDVGYEKSDVNVKKIVIPSVLFMVIISVCLVALDQYFLMSKETMYYNQVLKPESKELKELQQKEHEVLSNYKMVDKEKGIVQVPIERAMELEVSENSR